MNAKKIYKRNNNWTAKNKDKILLVLPKGEKDKIKKYAEYKGLSVNALIAKLIDEGIDRDLSYRIHIDNEDTQTYQFPWE